MLLAILPSLKTMESLQNGFATHFGATPLFSMREVSLVSSQHCCSVGTDAQCKRILTEIDVFTEYPQFQVRKPESTFTWTTSPDYPDTTPCRTGAAPTPTHQARRRSPPNRCRLHPWCPSSRSRPLQLWWAPHNWDIIPRYLRPLDLLQPIPTRDRYPLRFGFFV